MLPTHSAELGLFNEKLAPLEIVGGLTLQITDILM